jgi:predicted NUDIX family phosphoesterase
MTGADELVLGLPRATIIGTEPWRGIRATDRSLVLELVERAGEYRPRGEAEVDPDWKQVIPYLLIRDGEQLFLMQRTAAGGDARLHDRWTLGIGGHLNPEDGGVIAGMRREFHEEMTAAWEPQADFLGVLNDDSTPVGQVHVGLVFAADAAGRALAVRETEKLRGSFVEPFEVRPVYDRLETWSQFLFDLVSRDRAEPTVRPKVSFT